MIDSKDPNAEQEKPYSEDSALQQPSVRGPVPSSDLYSDLFGLASEEPPQKRSSQLPGRQTSPHAATAPLSPVSLAESGLTLMQICDLILKQLYLHGSLVGVQIARHARLPFQVIDEGLRFLKDEKCIEVASGESIGPASYRFHLTDLGRRRAREAFDQCRYVGPAPVTLEAYIQQCRRQKVTGTDCTADLLSKAFGDLIIPPRLLEELGPSVCSGKSIFVYGPPGNGKTMVAKGLGNFLNTHGGEIYVPYAIEAENSIITLFDPTIHQATDHEEVLGVNVLDLDMEVDEDAGQTRTQPTTDLRWRRIKRPVVVTGGELTLEMLDLRHNVASNYYTAPLHIKANSGVFLIDDFGRQIVSPRDLLNRWILPLEERVDYLTLSTGKKFSVPFEQLIIFSTNLDPRELVDEAFLRRIRHKIQIGSPDRDLYTEIFKLGCRQRDLQYDAACVDYLYLNYYDQGKLPRSSDPRDLLEIAQSICRFRNQQVLLTPELIAESAERFFCQV